MKPRVLVSAFACAPGGGSATLGGGEQVLGWRVIKQLGRFHDITVLTDVSNRASIEAALGLEHPPGVRFCYLDLPRWLRPLQLFQGGIQLYAYLWQVAAYFVARSLHKQFHFDAFHHVTYANDWMASFIGALLPIPYIRGPGGGAHRTPKVFLGEYPLRSRLWERVRALGQWLLRHDPLFVLGQRRARAILVCNHEALKAIPKKWRHKALLFPVNGVAAEDFAVPASPRVPDRRFRVLSAGKLLCIKGFALAIRAFKAFLERYEHTEPADRAGFAIVGDGPERHRLENLVRQLGLEDQVRFEGWVPREKVIARMGCCDVFLFPSLRDGGGAVVVEAMAAGKPVVSLDLGGPGLHVTKECGIKVPATSPEQAVRELAAALERLYQDPELRLQMGRAARQRAAELYHWDTLGERMLEIYKDALGIQQGEA